MSGDRTRGTITRCVDAGMTDFIQKPIDPTILLQKLSKHLGVVLEPISAEKAEEE